MTCPFKVGDRIRCLRVQNGFGHGPEYPADQRIGWEDDTSGPAVTVTALTERGFTYRFDQPVSVGRAQWGWTSEGGECFEGGFCMWRKVT